MPQGLITPGWMGVMVRMPLQLIQEQVGHHMVAVPAVLRLGALILAALVLLAQQAIVLNVIHALQQACPINRLRRQERHRPGAADQRSRTKEPGTHGPALQQLIVQAPETLALALKPRLLDFHCGLHATKHRARQELPETLAHPAAGRVFRCGNPLVMTKIVLNHEVGVTGRRQCRMAINLFSLLDLWPSSWAVLMPTPLIAPTVRVRPILSSIGVFLRLASQAPITVMAYWVGIKAFTIRS